MSFLICTPAHGGLVTLPHFNSCLELRENLIRSGVKHSWLTTQNESLITRGRDCLAATFLKQDYEALLFIDADIEFKPEDVAKLWNMDVDVAVAAYSMKKMDLAKFSKALFTETDVEKLRGLWHQCIPPVSAWKDRKLVKLSELGTDPVEVDYAGTGFMMIKRHVFEKLREAHLDWRYEDGIGEVCGFFQDPIEDVGGTLDKIPRIKLSEDYFFCKRWRELGGKIILDPTIRLKHWGSFPYGG